MTSERQGKCPRLVCKWRANPFLGAAAPSMCSTRPATVRKARPWASSIAAGGREVGLLDLTLNVFELGDTVGLSAWLEREGLGLLRHQALHLRTLIMPLCNEFSWLALPIRQAEG
jgi:hypothetical protein